MSLVHEALRKAERERLRKTGATVAGRSAVPRPAPAQAVPAGAATVPERDPRNAKDQAAPTRTPLTLVLVSLAAVAIVAVAANVFLVTRPANRPSADGNAAVAAPSPAPEATASAPAHGVDLSAPSPVAAEPSVSPPVPSEPTGGAALDPLTYRLTGIMTDPQDGRFCAVINGRVLYEDQYVDGAIVKRIFRDRVVLDRKGQEHTLRLF